MMYFKGCPKCGGDVYLDSDIYGELYQKCIQCGYVRHMKTVAKKVKTGNEAGRV